MKIKTTELCYTTLLEANLKGADLRGVRYNEFTTCPNTAGAVLMLE